MLNLLPWLFHYGLSGMQDANSPSPLGRHLFIKRFMEELNSIKKLLGQASSASISNAPRWIPPEEGTSKINMDGVVARDGSCGSFCAVARSSSGVYLGSSVVMTEGVNDPEILETMACREGLALAMDLQLTKIKRATDCKGVVSDLMKGSSGSNATILLELNQRALSFVSCSFVHEGRRSNVEAHCLAKNILFLYLKVVMCGF